MYKFQNVYFLVNTYFRNKLVVEFSDICLCRVGTWCTSEVGLGLGLQSPCIVLQAFTLH